jgi:dTDP-4-dehydrorhamnose reductase
MSSNPRVVLIGGKGQVAMSLARILPARGFEVTVLARPEYDLTRPAELADAIAAARPSVVINPAAYTAVDRAEDEPVEAFAINRDGAAAISSAAAHAGAAIIHFSTDYVFDGKKTSPYVETDATGPQGVYGASKLAGEAAVALVNPRHVILRTAWVCSADGANFLKTMLRLAAERPELRVVDDQRGSPTFAAGIAEATAVVARAIADPSANASHFGVFHLASAGETSWCGFARAIMAASKALGGPSVPVKAITTADFPTKAFRPAYSKLDTSKLARTYGIEMPEWEAAMHACLGEILSAPKT